MVTDEGFYDVSELLECGVYILLRRGVVVYVGQSKVMLNRVYTHRAKEAPHWFKSQTKIVFDEVWVKPCSVEELDTLERAMIVKYQPLRNVHHKNTKQRVPMPLANIAQSIMTHRRIASPSAAPRPQIDRRGR